VQSRWTSEPQSSAESAKNQLIQTCTDQALLTQARDVESQLAQWRRDASNLRNAISDLRDRARNEHALAAQAQRIVHGEERLKEHQENAKRHERSAAGCEAQLVLAEKAITRLERQEHGIRDQMLVA
jgi:chromosome segregation ATPase